MTKTSDKLAKACREALNNCPEVYDAIAEAGENAEQVKEAMYMMLYTAALLNNDKLREEFTGELFEEVQKRIA